MFVNEYGAPDRIVRYLEGLDYSLVDSKLLVFRNWISGALRRTGRSGPRGSRCGC